jgi:hypothetical protein
MVGGKDLGRHGDGLGKVVVHCPIHAGDYTNVGQDIHSLCSALNTLQLQEDHANLQHKYNTYISHTTSQKLTAQSMELTTCECQVGSLIVELVCACAACPIN